MTRLLAWIVDIVMSTAHRKPKPKPALTADLACEGVRVSAAGMARLGTLEIVRISAGGMAQMTQEPEIVRVSTSVSARLTGSPAPIAALAAVVAERARLSAIGLARIDSGPERVRVSDLCAALLTGPHKPVVGSIVCDFCSDELRIADTVTARIGGSSY